MFARLFVLILFALGLANSQALATSYKPPEVSDIFVYKPDYPCNMDFEDISRFDYASCLLLREEDDSVIIEENKSEALTILRDLVDNDGHVQAAYFLAQYPTEFEYKDGEFGNSVDVRDYYNETIDYYNEEIEAYRKVLSTIDLAPNYPYPDNMVAEAHHQMELMSHYSMVVLHYYKSSFGLDDGTTAALLRSPSYTGDKDFTTTLDSLDRVIQYGRECQSLPEKQHFKSYEYEAVTKSCRFYVGLAQTLKPLEERRLSILKGDSCRDLNPNTWNPDTCPEYFEVALQMQGMDKAYTESIADVWSPFNDNKDNSLMFGVP